MLVRRVGYSVDPLGKFGRIGSAAAAPWCVDHQQPKPGVLRPRPDQKTVEELDQAGFTAIYPNVWSRGTTFHRSRFAPVEPSLAKAGIDLDPICTFNTEARKRG